MQVFILDAVIKVLDKCGVDLPVREEETSQDFLLAYSTCNWKCMTQPVDLHHQSAYKSHTNWGFKDVMH